MPWIIGGAGRQVNLGRHLVEESNAYGFLLESEERRATMTKEETQEYIGRVNELELDTVTKVGCQLMVMAVQYIEQTGQPPREALETLFKDATAGKWKFEPPNVSSDG